MEEDIQAYHKLINDGGRPLYPLHLIEDVNRDPEDFDDMLHPWKNDHSQTEGQGIFIRQLERWQDFRKWQNDNRGREDPSDTFQEFIEDRKANMSRYCMPADIEKELAEIEGNPECLRSDWEGLRWHRNHRLSRIKDHGCNGFHDYTEAVKRRLESHDFTQPFELNEDPQKQNTLMTWIEYLNYEYWWMDTYTRLAKRLELAHDKQWRELVDMKIAESHERRAGDGGHCRRARSQIEH